MTLKFIIVGAGLIGPRHAQSILSNPSTDLVALIDPLPSAATTAQKLGTSYYPTIEATLQAIPKPDAAIVCTPNHTHVAITKQLLLANIHVLVEKPLSDNIASARELLSLLKQPQHAHLKLLVGHHRRFNPYVLKTKELLTSSATSLGHIIAINGLWTLLKPDSYFSAPTAWRASSTTGGGVIPINLIHDIDILHYLLGPITRVHAEQTPRNAPTPPKKAPPSRCASRPAQWAHSSSATRRPPRITSRLGPARTRLFRGWRAVGRIFTASLDPGRR
ncbi:NAD(P)-binding protein [Aspergillus campestris IBT 28561]|uniref:NAD(P)-binding protein n=1 Tax=Aspergillus campestris (strain IBT 28561) TaxID=1392248 RepID=A0A2I1DFR5_ASPC2|nr:NAD(P)-binding protein [Aspergillus campestris IBT 28561]PKY08716.1 NAD(P)-binding protein [Aspergillus campestris IBT 28561]